MIEIDPLDAAIQYLKANNTLSGLVNGQIAAKHRYGLAWEQGSAGLVAKLDGGGPHLYVPMQTVRLELQCYGNTSVEAMNIWRHLVSMSREDQRVKVSVKNGEEALVYHFLQDSGPSLLYDQDLEMDFVLVFFKISMCELKLI